jgi:3'(2'), 5'-bisphosphate nucleotidase
MKDLKEILAIAREVGWQASDILRSYYHGTAKDPNLEVQYKQNEPVTVADVAVSQYILQRLQAALGNEDFAYISEETYQSSSIGAHWMAHETLSKKLETMQFTLL